MMFQSTARSRGVFVLVMTVVVAACIGALVGVAGAVDGDLQVESDLETPQAGGVDEAPDIGSVDGSVDETADIGSVDGSVDETADIGSVDEDPHIDIRLRELSLPEYVDEDTSGEFEMEVFNAGRDDARMEIIHAVDGTVVNEERVVAERGSGAEASYTISYEDVEDAVGDIDGEETVPQRVRVHAVGVEGDDEFREQERGSLTVVGPEEADDEDDEDEPAGTVEDVDAELVDITDAVEVDEAVTVAVEITNPTDLEVDAEIHYGAAGDLVHRQHVEVAEDESRVFRFRVPVERIARAADIKFPPGEVEIDQHVRLGLSGENERGETLAEQEELRVLVDEDRLRAGEYNDLEGIAIVEPDDEEVDDPRETEEPQEVEEDVVVETQPEDESAQTQRGFLTNDGAGTGTPLDDPFVLTVVGFLLSVVSILYQMSRM